MAQEFLVVGCRYKVPGGASRQPCSGAQRGALAPGSWLMRRPNQRQNSLKMAADTPTHCLCLELVDLINDLGDRSSYSIQSLAIQSANASSDRLARQPRKSRPNFSRRCFISVSVSDSRDGVDRLVTSTGRGLIAISENAGSPERWRSRLCFGVARPTARLRRSRPGGGVLLGTRVIHCPIVTLGVYQCPYIPVHERPWSCMLRLVLQLQCGTNGAPGPIALRGQRSVNGAVSFFSHGVMSSLTRRKLRVPSRAAHTKALPHTEPPIFFSFTQQTMASKYRMEDSSSKRFYYQMNTQFIIRPPSKPSSSHECNWGMEHSQQGQLALSAFCQRWGQTRKQPLWTSWSKFWLSFRHPIPIDGCLANFHYCPGLFGLCPAQFRR